jgi:hypothetical protein
MPAKTTPGKTKRGKSKANRRQRTHRTSTMLVLTNNLINMVVVSGVSGAVLLGLLAARHFSDGRF